MTIPATFFFFFLVRSSSIWFMAWEKDPGWLKSYLAVAGRGLGAALIPEVYQRGSSKTTRLRRLLVLLETKPSKKKPRIFFFSASNI